MPGQSNSTQKTTALLEEFVLLLPSESPKSSSGSGRDLLPSSSAKVAWLKAVSSHQCEADRRGENGQDVDWIGQQSNLQKVGAWEGDDGAAESMAVLRRARGNRGKKWGLEKRREKKTNLLYYCLKPKESD